MTMPKTMRAAILVELRQPLVVTEIALPSELAAGQVLVRIEVSGICGSQLGEIDGAKGEDHYLPHLLGHEGSGRVEAIGPGVRHVKPGDKVVLHWRKGAGIDSVAPSYDWNGRKVNAGWVTTFNEYAIVSENRVTAIPDDTDPEVAALFGCAVTTGFGTVVNDARLTIGESVVVFGAGGVGLNIVQAAALVSADPIIAVDLFDNRLELARQMGATHTINARAGDARRQLAELLGKEGCDVFVDNTGDPAIIELGYELVKAQGRLVLVGVPKKGRSATLYTLPIHFGKVITGSHGGETQPDRDIPRYLSLYRRGKLNLKALISDRTPLDGINDAIAAMREGRIAGRCLIRM